MPPSLLDGGNPQLICNLLSQHRAANEAKRITTSSVESEGVMCVSVSVTLRVDALPVQPVAFLAVAEAPEVIGDGIDERRVDGCWRVALSLHRVRYAPPVWQ